MEEWSFSSTHSQIWHCVKDSEQLHALAALPLGKAPDGSYRVGGQVAPAAGVKTLDKEKSILFLPGTELRFRGVPVSKLVNQLTELINLPPHSFFSLYTVHFHNV
jgi:hypothetical protein